MVNERPEMLAKSATLYFGPWYRQSPFFKATLRAGCSAYDIYNHMYLPGYYDDPEVEYRALNESVVVWDVGVERTVQVAGPDADRLIDMITCRDLTTCAVKQGKYMIVTAPDGGIVNDPVLLHVAEDTWWMQLADSDAHLYALGVAATSGLDVDVTLPDVHPMQVQGPLSAKTLEKLVGPSIYDLRYYWCDHFEIQGIRPTAPSEARRIEAGIFNYGSDMTIDDTPLHLMGLERLVEDQPQDYLGKAALERLKVEGVDRKLVGIELEGDELRAEISEFWPVHHEGERVGKMTDAIWSPGLEKNIGYVWVPIGLTEPGTRLDVETEDGEHLVGRTAAIPFVDPRKERPAGSLAS
jgi:glycine cleavage system aminomethyltransferase T